MTVVNDAVQHWSGIEVPLVPASDKGYLQRIVSTINEFEANQRSKSYLDVHNYQFIPSSMDRIVETLYALGLIRLRVHRVYETVKDQLEFYIVLRKCE
jgi:hypothetical protein